jgi:hypothetical protein
MMFKRHRLLLCRLPAPNKSWAAISGKGIET